MTVVERGSRDADPRRRPRADDGSGGAVGARRPGPDLPRQRRRRDERRTVTVAVAAAVAAFVPTAAVATLVAGTRGLLGAAVGTLLVLVLFGVGAALMLWAGRRGPSSMLAAAGGGVAARLMVYAAVLTGLDAVDVVHRPSLAVAAAVTLVITLAGEFAVLSRTPSLFSVEVPDSAPSARPQPSDDRTAPVDRQIRSPTSASPVSSHSETGPPEHSLPEPSVPRSRVPRSRVPRSGAPESTHDRSPRS